MAPRPSLQWGEESEEGAHLKEGNPEGGLTHARVTAEASFLLQAKIAPRSHQDRPKSLQDGPKSLQDGSNMVQEGPKRPPERSR